MNVSLYTDGSCNPNLGYAGYAAIIKKGGQKKELVGTLACCSINRVELLAIIHGLSQVNPDSHVTVFTDSAYVERAINEGRLLVWKTNGWRRIRTGEPIQNSDLWQVLSDTMKQRRLSVRFRKLKAHKGNYLNERADFLARKAAKEGA